MIEFISAVGVLAPLQPPEDRRRFWKRFLLVLGIVVAVIAIVVGICVAIILQDI